MSAVSNLGFKGHCLIGTMTIGAGAIAGGVFLGSVVTGALCGVARHVIDLTAMATGIYDSRSDVLTVSRFVVMIFKGIAIQAVLSARGLAMTVSPLAVCGFILLSYGLHLAAIEIIKANKEWVNRCLA